MKKLLWILGGLLFAFVVAVLSIPLFVNVDQYRPYVTAEANKRINGKLELGRLSLSLWGAVKIHADSIQLKVNGFPEPLLDTKQFHVEIPFSSLLSGKPQLVAVLDSPKISVVKEPDGRMNVMELFPKSASSQAAPAPTVSPAPPAITDEAKMVEAAPEKTKAKRAVKLPGNVKGGSKASVTAAPSVAVSPVDSRPASSSPVPAAPLAEDGAKVPSPAPEPMKVPTLVKDAKIGLRIVNGDLRYADKLAKAEYLVNGLDLEGKNLGLGSNMELKVKAPVKGANPSLSFSGPITLEAGIMPVLAGNSVKSARGRIDLDATPLALEVKGAGGKVLFQKPVGMPLKANVQLDGNEAETIFRALDLQLADYKIHGKGRLVAQPLSAKLDITTDPGTVRLEKLQALVPMIEAYQLKGVADLNADVDWRPELLRANGDLKVTEGSFFLKEMVREPMQFKLQAGFTESSLNLTRAALSGPETELELTGSLKNFLAPSFSFALSGKSFNIDKALVLPAKKSSADAARPETNTASVISRLIPEAFAEEPAAEVNPMLEVAKNPVVANATGNFVANIQRVTVYGALLEQVTARAQLAGMSLKVTEASLKTFGGVVKAQAEANLKSPGLSFGTQGNVAGLNAQQAFKTYFPKYERTLEGMVDANWNVSGAAFPAATRIRSLKGGAKLIAKDGAVKSVDFQDSINSAMQKIPFLKDQKPVKIDNGFKTLTAEIRFDNGTIHAEPIEVLPRNQGLVVKGKSSILESLEQETLLDIYDPQGQLPKELANPGKPAIALRIFGPLTAPKTDYEYTLKRVATVAGKNVLKDQALKALGVSNDPKKSDQDKLKEAADALKKKFGF